MRLSDAFKSAVKISCIICTAGIALGLLDILLFILCLIVFTFGIYLFRLAFPIKPITDIYDIEDMYKDYLTNFMHILKGKLPLKIKKDIDFVDVYINEKQFICSFICYYDSETILPEEVEIKKDMISQLKKDSPCPLVFISLVYLKLPWVVRYKCVNLKKNIEIALNPSNIEEEVSKWHTFGEEYKNEWGK